MAKNRCTSCGGKFGLVCQQHWGLRFCRKACKDDFLAKAARMRKWLGCAQDNPSKAALVHLLSLAERGFHSANKIDYLIGRWVVSDQPLNQGERRSIYG